jgi:microcystin degradation protein MlrC
MSRVAVASLMHESNSFNPVPTLLSDFTIEERSVELWSRTNTEVAGFLQAATELECIPVFSAWAVPSGPVEEQAYETLLDGLLKNLASCGRIDGVYLALHGAMVAEHIPHADLETVRRVQEQIGADTPLVVTHDFHANISPEMAHLTTALITYQQNPHVDTKQRGARAASILTRTLRGEVMPVQAIAKPPMIWNIVYQNTNAEPLLSVTRDSMQLEQRPDILAASVSGGYQYADVPYVGPSTVVVADGARETAAAEAERLANELWRRRSAVQVDLPDAEQAVAQAMAAPEHPVALFDAGDNVGGGSAADSTVLLSELLKQNANGWVIVIYGPEAVRHAMRTGVDGVFDLDVGGPPVRIRGRVRSLHAGRYMEPEVRHGGARFHDLGHSAVIEYEGSTPELQNLLLLTSKRSLPFSLHQLVSCGIYPERQKILIVKGTVAPRAAYEPVAKKIILVDTPGSTAVNPARFTYRHARPGLFGLAQGE